MAVEQPNKTRERALFELAERQAGLFTAHQASELGFAEGHQFYHVKAGNWKREARGIYRLFNFPLSDHLEWMLYYLWSRGRNGEPQGVFSHQSALQLYDLTDLDPHKLHLTVPKNFRRHSTIPKILVLHKENIAPSDIREMHGFRVTTPLRTIQDVVSDPTLSPEWKFQAVQQSLERGLVSETSLNHAGLDADFLQDARSFRESA